jgi:hypothetical protein
MATVTTLNRPAPRQLSKSITRWLPATARVLLGLLFFVCGLNGFLNFLPRPSTPMPEGAVAFAGSLMQTGYMFALIAGTQFVAGTLLLVNRFVPLGLVLLAPVAVNILAFHLFLAPAGLSMAVIVIALEAYLAWTYRQAYRPVLAIRALPK